jgi:hypothetical protein
MEHFHFRPPPLTTRVEVEAKFLIDIFVPAVSPSGLAFLGSGKSRHNP